MPRRDVRLSLDKLPAPPGRRVFGSPETLASGSAGDLPWALHWNRAVIPVMTAISPPKDSAQRETTTRKPMLLFRFVGSLLFRFAERQFRALLFQEPPRSTRFDPDDCGQTSLRTRVFYIRPGPNLR